METGRWTCVGMVKPELYSQSLKSMCQQNEWNQNRLKAEMDSMPRPKSAVKKQDGDFYNPCLLWEKKNVMFTTADAVRNLGDNRSVGSDAESVTSIKAPPVTFCYLCSTMEEHLKHHEKTVPKKPAKPRITFIAPPPQVRRKKETRPSLTSTEALYKVEVFTADKPNASTDANVYISINGSEDYLPRTKLHKNSGCAKFLFGRSSREKFYIKGPKLGNLETLTIEHDGLEEKHSWCLEKLEVTDMATKDSWIFLCNKWLSLHIKDFKIKRHLKASPKEVVKAEYKIIVHTGKKAFAGTDAAVFITLFGEERNSPKILLKDPSKNCFEKGCVDSFQVRLGDLGKLKKIRIEHDGKGMAPGWFLDHVVIYKVSEPRHKFYCYCNSWLSRDEAGGRLWKELPARNRPRTPGSTNGNKVKYEVKVKTGDVKYGGTDANVFIQMVGPDGVTNEIDLDDAKNNFERNMLDVFTVEADNVGPLEKILIGHDNTGVGAGWFLDKVCIRRFVPHKEASTRASGKSKSGPAHMKPRRRVRTRSADSRELRELEQSESLGILERQILLELKAEADLIRRQKWEVYKERWSSEEDLSDSSDDDNELHGSRRRRDRRSSRAPDSSVQLTSDRRRSSPHDTRRPSTAARHRSSDQEESEEERSSKGRRGSEVKKAERTPAYEDYAFLCHQWLSSDEGDKKIVRELMCNDKKVHFKD